ncbi:MAG: prepilin-type N-terminal cleavage/methylation domain-containing protein [Kiritimatiellae bacterium]|nr:prepilin-type N-terminal cleavage/methylation domain-containing protein [Kiritimatiellia bacterium]
MNLPVLAARAERSRGFTLVEINLALLIVGVGLISLLGLFPVGLRQANMATADCAQAMFADQVLNMLHANATTMTNWARWKSNFNNDILDQVRVSGATIVVGVPATIDNYLGIENNVISYRLTFESVEKPIDFKGYVMRARIQVGNRPHTEMAVTNSPTYCSDFVYMGSVPK